MIWKGAAWPTSRFSTVASTLLRDRVRGQRRRSRLDKVLRCPGLRCLIGRSPISANSSCNLVSVHDEDVNAVVATGRHQYPLGSCACGGRSPTLPQVDPADPDHHQLWAICQDRRLNSLCQFIELRTQIVPQVCEVLDLADLGPRIVEDNPSDNRTAVLRTDDHTYRCHLSILLLVEKDADRGAATWRACPADTGCIRLIPHCAPLSKSSSSSRGTGNEPDSRPKVWSQQCPTIAEPRGNDGVWNPWRTSATRSPFAGRSAVS